MLFRSYKIVFDLSKGGTIKSLIAKKEGNKDFAGKTEKYALGDVYKRQSDNLATRSISPADKSGRKLCTYRPIQDALERLYNLYTTQTCDMSHTCLLYTSFHFYEKLCFFIRSKFIRKIFIQTILHIHSPFFIKERLSQ